MQKDIVKIVALSVDPTQITLWKEDGSTIRIPQGDVRVANIVQQAKDNGLKPGVAVEVSIAATSHYKHEYAETEKGTNGVVKFFRIARAKLAEFFRDEEEKTVKHVEPIDLGAKPDLYKELINKAIATTVAIQDAAPAAVQEMEVVPDEGSNSIWLNGYDADTSKTALIAAIRNIRSDGLASAHGIVNGNLPYCLMRSISDNKYNYFADLLRAIKGVHFGKHAQVIDTKPKSAPETVKKTNDEKLEQASSKLKALGAVSTEQPSFHEDVTAEETVVAVVAGKVVPDVQNLQRQIRQSAKLKDFKGFELFLQRIAGVIDQRRHSVEDLMKFMEIGDLPIADDGSIVIFKRLRKLERKGNYIQDAERVYVDCHTKNIEQAVGSLVRVEEHLVDQDRRQDCSNGLHVASLSYLSGFSGDVTIIGKVAPEKVFAVPQYSTNKMRVAEYHIIAELPMDMRLAVNSGKSITSVEGGIEFLNKVLTGDHAAPNMLVTVSGHRGTKLAYTKLSMGEVSKEANVTKTKTALDLEEPLTQEAQVAEPIAATALLPIAKKGTKMEEVLKLWESFTAEQDAQKKAELADQIVAIKGKSNKSYSSLGISNSMVDQLIAARTVKPVVKTTEPAKKVVKSAPAKQGKVADDIRKTLNDAGINDFTKAHIMHDMKRAAKKSYSALGLSADEIKQIDKLKHHLK